MPETRLTRSETDNIIAGVCGGLAAYIGIDVVLVRLAFLALFFATGIGLPIYIILWVITPEEGDTGDGNVFQDTFDDIRATKINDGQMSRQSIVGLIFILLGAYFLLQHFGILLWLTGELIWPIVIVGLGIYLFVRRS